MVVETARICEGGLELSYENCVLCPRNCRVDRARNRLGFCGQKTAIKMACALLHHGEEPPLTGAGGSGTVFFAGCNLQCSFCQNYQLSREGIGGEITPAELARIFLALQERGAENINLVSGTPFIPAICVAVDSAREQGLEIPLVWNTSSYEDPASLAHLMERIDVYLADLKTLDPDFSLRFLGTPEYPEAAKKAIKIMLGSRRLRIKDGMIKEGVIVRHLIMPGFIGMTYGVLRWLRKHVHERGIISIMAQYMPVASIPGPSSSARPMPPARRISEDEYNRVLGWLEELQIEDGFIQDCDTEATWRPDFARRNPFPADHAVPLWHYRTGRIGPQS
jgi:putative pyruvate formate lyase activating enzyme